MVLHYQPKVDLGNHRVSGVEALVRWQRQDGSLVFPDAFIPLVESAGLMPMLTAAVLDKALDQYLVWRDRGIHLRVAVNVAASLLADPRAVPHVANALSSRSISPASLILEVTESVVMSDVEKSLHTLRALAHMGITLSIDDFGTGYSSLAYLSQLPVKELKIDRAFVMTMTSNENHRAVVGSILGLGHGFGHKVTAEGVEDLATYLMLQRAGCDIGQGYFISRPLTAVRFGEWLRDEWPSRVESLIHAASAVVSTETAGVLLDEERDLHGLRLHAYEELMECEAAAECVRVVSDYVVSVGGRIGTATDAEDPDAIPIDVSLGEGDALLPIAAMGSRARRQLDKTLPKLVSDGRRLATLLRARLS